MPRHRFLSRFNQYIDNLERERQKSCQSGWAKVRRRSWVRFGRRFTREDMQSIELKARQRLVAFLLRHHRVYREGESRWTQKQSVRVLGGYTQCLVVQGGRLRALAPRRYSAHVDGVAYCNCASKASAGLHSPLRAWLSVCCGSVVTDSCKLIPCDQVNLIPL